MNRECTDRQHYQNNLFIVENVQLPYHKYWVGLFLIAGLLAWKLAALLKCCIVVADCMSEEHNEIKTPSLFYGCCSKRGWRCAIVFVYLNLTRSRSLHVNNILQFHRWSNHYLIVWFVFIIKFVSYFWLEVIKFWVECWVYTRLALESCIVRFYWGPFLFSNSH